MILKKEILLLLLYKYKIKLFYYLVYGKKYYIFK